jgi:hypothetical protein
VALGTILRENGKYVLFEDGFFFRRGEAVRGINITSECQFCELNSPLTSEKALARTPQPKTWSSFYTKHPICFTLAIYANHSNRGHISQNVSKASPSPKGEDSSTHGIAIEGHKERSEPEGHIEKANRKQCATSNTIR